MAEPRSGLPGFQVTTSEIKIKEAVGEGGFKTVPSPPVAAHVRTDKHCAVRIPTAGKASGFVCSRRVGSTPYCTPYLHLVDYFLSTPTLCLRQSLYSSGQPIVANVSIHENHADVSSAAAEIYAAGNATMDFLALSYVASEAGVSFPETITLQVDNAACQAFASQTRYSGRSRLRHIDARQQWVHCLRDSNLVKTVHVPSPENLADFFTKALALSVFLPMRARMMHFARCPVASAA